MERGKLPWRGSVVLALALGLWGSFGAGGCGDSTPRIVSGREFPMERLVAVRRGLSTQRQVTEIFGPPLRTEKLDERRERWKYYMRKETNTYALGIFPTGTQVIENELIIIFDGNFVESVDKKPNSYRM